MHPSYETLPDGVLIVVSKFEMQNIPRSIVLIDGGILRKSEEKVVRYWPGIDGFELITWILKMFLIDSFDSIE